MDNNEYRTLLERGIKAMGLSFDSPTIDKLLAYHALLVKWNQAYNLTAVRDPQEMIGRHLLDSLSIYPFLQGKRILDVGSGGGMPGIPMAICYPERSFTLLDSNGKKTRFLTQCKISLGLNNLTVVQSRIEAFEAEAFDGITSRAFATLKDMVDGSFHLLAENGLFQAMKGVYPEAEIAELDSRVTVVHCHPLTVPGEPGERHLVVMKKQ